MISLGLLGKDIRHSRSKEMYQKILNQMVDYHLFDFSHENNIPSLDHLMQKVSGLSITSPYKKVFLNVVKMQPEIADLEAINCIKKVGNDFYATNTDYLALNQLIDEVLERFDLMDEIFILGDGAMGKVMVKICQLKNIKYRVYSRKIGNLNNLSLEISNKAQGVLVINTCSREYLFNQHLPMNSVFWDLNYNMPSHESFFQKKQITYIDGLSLLEQQARHAVTFWNLKFS